MVGKLEKVDLRKVWIREAKDFNTWLANNLDVLSEQIGFSLSLIEKEKSAGAFSVDIFAERSNGSAVVIENQLEQTDHDHLGKLITYLSSLEAKTAIWITSTPRAEHVKAVNWLNEISPVDTAFFLVKVEAYRIGESEPAAFFTTICAPSAEVKQIGEQREDLAERHVKRLDFWKQLLERAILKTTLHSNVSPSKENWIAAGAGKSGMGWSYAITMNKGSVELFIDRGPEKEEKEETDKIFDAIRAEREKIENRFGETLIWDKVDGRRICRIKSVSEIGGLKDTQLWPKILEDMVDRMIRLEKALRPTLAALK